MWDKKRGVRSIRGCQLLENHWSCFYASLRGIFGKDSIEGNVQCFQGSPDMNCALRLLSEEQTRVIGVEKGTDTPMAEMREGERGGSVGDCCAKQRLESEKRSGNGA